MSNQNNGKNALLAIVGLIAIGALIVSCLALTKVGKESLGSGITPWITSGETLVGASDNLDMLASSTAFADSVAAIGTLTGAVDQLVVTSKLDNVILNIMARGGTVTSSLFVRQMGSYDGINYFDLATSTADRTSPTTTIATVPIAIQWDPGTVTSSMSVPFETFGYKYTRFIIWGEDVQADPDDGTYVWIQAIRVEPSFR